MARGLKWLFELQDRMSGPAGRIQRSLRGVGAGLRQIDLQARYAASAWQGRLLNGLTRVANADVGPVLRRTGGVLASMGRGALAVGGSLLRVGLLAGGIAAAGIGALGHRMVETQQRAQDTRVALADALNASGSTSSWTQSMEFAAGAMQRIRRDAAALPGTAEEYVTVFRAGLPAALASGMRSLDDITNLTDAVAAFGSMRGIDAEQTGRDLGLMLRGRAGLHVRTFSELLPDLTTAARARGLNVTNSHQFNALSAAQRVQVLQGAASAHGAGLQAAGQTWSAQLGTLEARLQEVLLNVSGPLFGRLTAALGRVNTFLEAHQPALEAFLGGLIDGGQQVLGLLGEMGAAVLPGILGAFHALEGPVRGLIAAVVPHLVPLASGLGDVIHGIAAGLGPVIRDLTPLFSGIIGALGPLLHDLGPLLTTMMLGLRIVLAPLFAAAELAQRQQAVAAAQANLERSNTDVAAMNRYNAMYTRVADALRGADPALLAQTRGVRFSDAEMGALNQAALQGNAQHTADALRAVLAARVPPSQPTTTAGALANGRGPVAVTTQVTVTAPDGSDPQAHGDAVAAGAQRGTAAALEQGHAR